MIVRRGDAHDGVQGLSYAIGITSVTSAARALCLTSAELPVGARSACHLHRGIESAGFVAGGTVDFWWGEQLDEHAVMEAGDFAYIPPNLPHVVGNAADVPALIVVAHSSSSDQDGIELRSELDRLLSERR